MIGLDTNIVLRVMLNDDPAQSDRVRSHARSGAWDDGAVVNPVVLAEAAWVLLKKMKRPKADVVDLLELLLGTEGIVVLNADAVSRALETYRNARCDFADCLIAELNAEVGARPTYSFDVDALTLPTFAPIPA